MPLEREKRDTVQVYIDDKDIVMVTINGTTRPLYLQGAEILAKELWEVLKARERITELENQQKHLDHEMVKARKKMGPERGTA